MMEIIANECLFSPDNRVKAVACFDLGEFARFHKFGKDICESNDVK